MIFLCLLFLAFGICNVVSAACLLIAMLVTINPTAERPVFWWANKGRQFICAGGAFYIAQLLIEWICGTSVHEWLNR
jgi:hypothetical protein